MFGISLSWAFFILRSFIDGVLNMISGSGDMALSNHGESKASQDAEEGAQSLSNGNTIGRRSLPHIFKLVSGPCINVDEIMEYFRKNKSSINDVTIQGKDTVLHRFVEWINESDVKHKDLLEFLLNNGAQVNVKNESGDTPLHIAARNNKYNTIRTLIKFSEKDQYTILKEVDQDGSTCLHVAVEKGYVQAVAILYLYKAYLGLERPNNGGFTAMDIASKTKYNDNKEAMEKISEILKSDWETHLKEYIKYLPGNSEDSGDSLWNCHRSIIYFTAEKGSNNMVLVNSTVKCNDPEDLKESFDVQEYNARS